MFYWLKRRHNQFPFQLQINKRNKRAVQIISALIRSKVTLEWCENWNLKIDKLYNNSTWSYCSTVQVPAQVVCVHFCHFSSCIQTKVLSEMLSEVEILQKSLKWQKTNFKITIYSLSLTSTFSDLLKWIYSTESVIYVLFKSYSMLFPDEKSTKFTNFIFISCFFIKYI